MEELYSELVDRYFCRWELDRAATCGEDDGTALLRRYAVESCRGYFGPDVMAYSTNSGHVFFGQGLGRLDNTVTVSRLAADAWKRHCSLQLQMALPGGWR
jgi:hypothetical protein